MTYDIYDLAYELNVGVPTARLYVSTWQNITGKTTKRNAMGYHVWTSKKALMRFVDQVNKLVKPYRSRQNTIAYHNKQYRARVSNWI